MLVLSRSPIQTRRIKGGDNLSARRMLCRCRCSVRTPIRREFGNCCRSFSWNRVWSLGLGCGSYQSQNSTYPSIYFVMGASGRWGCLARSNTNAKNGRGNNLGASCGEYLVVVVVGDSPNSGTKSDTREGEVENDYQFIPSESMTLSDEQPMWSSSSIVVEPWVAIIFHGIFGGEVCIMMLIDILHTHICNRGCGLIVIMNST